MISCTIKLKSRAIHIQLSLSAIRSHLAIFYLKSMNLIGSITVLYSLLDNDHVWAALETQNNYPENKYTILCTGSCAVILSRLESQQKQALIFNE